MSRIACFVGLAGLFLAATSTTTLAAPGDVDISFGTRGAADLRIGDSVDQLELLAQGADGKLVAFGHAYNRTLLFARFNADGSADTTFGTAGHVAIDQEWNDRATPAGLAIQADGRIVYAVNHAVAAFGDVHRLNADGSSDATFKPPQYCCNLGELAIQADGRIVGAYTNAVELGAPPPAVATGFGAFRVMPDGTPDSSFGAFHNGVALAGFPYGMGDVLARSIVLQADGGIVVSGQIGGGRAGAIRLAADGTIDTFRIAVAGTHFFASALEPDGRLVFAGCTVDKFDGSVSAPAIRRFSTDGTLDTTFAGGVVTPAVDPASCITGLAARPGGQVLFNARRSADTSQFVVGQLNVDGSADAGFGSAGIAAFSAQTTKDRSKALLLQPGGQAIVGGDVRDRDFGLMRLGTTGQVDSTFGAGGAAVAAFHEGRGLVGVRAVRQSAGKLVVLVSLGDADLLQPVQGEVGLLRLNADGTRDAAFGTNGEVVDTLSPSRTAGSVTHKPLALAVQADGKLLVGGLGELSGEQWLVVMRFNADGSIDPSFGDAGRKFVEKAQFGQGIEALQVLADGRILAAGRIAPNPNLPCAYCASANSVAVARLLSSGALDASFGTGGIVAVAPSYPADGSAPGIGRVTLAMQGDRALIGLGTGQPFSAVRILPDGSIDPAFGSAGLAYLDRTPPVYDMRAFDTLSSSSLLVHGDGRVTFAGDNNGPAEVQCAGSKHFAAFMRYGADGTVAPGTASGGFLATYLGGEATVNRAVLDARDGIVAAGVKSHVCAAAAYVARFTAGGALDTTFGQGGNVTLLPWQQLYNPRDVIVQDDGSLLVAGEAWMPPATVRLVRLQGGGAGTPQAAPDDTDNDGIPDPYETSNGGTTDPLIRDNDIFSDARLFAMQQYRDFLGREGDAAGVDFWTGQVSTGAQTRSQVIESFFNSAEFQSGTPGVARLYFAYFLRIPDFAGLDFWVRQARGGMPLAAISDAFASSAEFANTYGALANPLFVDLVYRNVLGREPDAAGRAFWIAQLDAGLSRGNLILSFSEGPEYASLTTHEVYVTMIYAGMLRRAPDAAGFAFWVDYMDRGRSGLDLIDGFRVSAEYHNRFLP